MSRLQKTKRYCNSCGDPLGSTRDSCHSCGGETRRADDAGDYRHSNLWTFVGRWL